MPLLDIRIPPRPKRPTGRPRSDGVPPRATQSRFLLEPVSGKSATMPPHDHPAIVDGRTIYPRTVRPLEDRYVLKSGIHQSKIGGRLLKGKWKGMPVYCLTLEERATCPRECQLWRACYGNAMHMAHRWRHGEALERRLRIEVARLAKAHTEGFAVRLHILGDFYSVVYVELWADLLRRHRELHVFGFSARWNHADPIARPLITLAMENWDRFAIRFSNAPVDTCSTVTIEHAGQRPADAIICPAQMGQTESCSTCGLCWQTERRIAFIRH
ncbi:hypothetical protein GCM10007913_11380 [Devosia yakushimensis]|uniref:Uncharacterized protein n=1 Tax=Devosia yakushimensis TaxID=470028 RepID=A0ABQ5UF65_9HYPH|nr:hypothetical protein [Devosia yakushimensis]GLQ09206.1 hypothetical protein GCM10007913_11380 [Devosia yakushimensis]